MEGRKRGQGVDQQQVGMRIAGQMMRDLGRGGRILSVASAAGGESGEANGGTE